MKKIFIGLFISVGVLFAQNGYVDVNVLLIKKYPSDKSVKFGYYKKYTQISVIGTHHGIDNDDKWYLTDRGYVRAKYVVLNKDLPKILPVHEVDTSKNAIQLAVYPKHAKYSLKEGIRKLQGEKNLFIEETSRAKVLYLVNFPSYRAALNKLNSIKAFKGFVTRIKLKNVVPKPKKTTKTVEVKNVKKEIKKNKEKSSDQVAMDDDVDFKEIMKKIYSDSEDRVKQIAKKPEVEEIKPQVIKKENYIELKSSKIETKSDYNMNRELSKTLEKALIELDRL